MHGIWNLLRYLPPKAQTAIKRYTSPDLRIWIRQKFGADPSSIPDRIATVADGRKFRIGPDWIYWAIHLGVEFEPEATGIVRRLIQPGDTIVDVGANFGWYTTLCAKATGPNGRVIAFEPVPSTFERLSENLERNGLSDRVTRVRSAAGEAAGEVEVYVFDGLSHSCSSLSPLTEEKFKTVKAPIQRLDDYLESNRIRHVDFIKCDVEGSEFSVLKGAVNLLRSKDAPMIMVELNADTYKAFGYSKEDIWQFLNDAGYDHFYDIRSATEVQQVFTVQESQKLHLMLASKGNTLEQRLYSDRPARAAA